MYDVYILYSNYQSQIIVIQNSVLRCRHLAFEFSWTFLENAWFQYFSSFRVASDLHFCSAFSARFHIFYMKPSLFWQEGKLSKAGCRHPSSPLCSFYFLLISFLIFIQYFSYSPFLVSSYFHSSPLSYFVSLSHLLCQPCTI